MPAGQPPPTALTRNGPGVSILFLGKQDDGHTLEALTFCKSNFDDVSAHLGRWGDPLPDEARRWQGDYIVSYLSRWVVPAELLARARKAAINFHPASPEYPGIGCNNFALYEGATEYGVTCHHMAPRVDVGSIIAVRRFPIYPDDDVEALLSRTYDAQLALYYEIMGVIQSGEPLPQSNEQWTRKPFTRKEFNDLGRIRPDMSREEIARRIRATRFGPWKPTIEVQGFVFELKS